MPPLHTWKGEEMNSDKLLHGGAVYPNLAVFKVVIFVVNFAPFEFFCNIIIFDILENGRENLSASILV